MKFQQSLVFILFLLFLPSNNTELMKNLLIDTGYISECEVKMFKLNYTTNTHEKETIILYNTYLLMSVNTFLNRFGLTWKTSASTNLHKSGLDKISTFKTKTIEVSQFDKKTKVNWFIHVDNTFTLLSYYENKDIGDSYSFQGKAMNIENSLNQDFNLKIIVNDSSCKSIFREKINELLKQNENLSNK